MLQNIVAFHPKRMAGSAGTPTEPKLSLEGLTFASEDEGQPPPKRSH